MLLSLKGKGNVNTLNPDHFWLAGNIEYFKRYTEILGFYTRASGIVSNNSLLDMPISIRDENGVRGTLCNINMATTS